MKSKVRQDEEMWQEMHDVRAVLDSRGISIDLLKVKSHATQAEMDKGLSSPQLKHGNDRADHYAGLGAKIYQVSKEDINLVYMTDARAWMIQKRLLHISQMMSDGHARSPKEKKPVPLIGTGSSSPAELRF